MFKAHVQDSCTCMCVKGVSREARKRWAPSVIWQIKVAGHGLNRAGRSRWMKEILRRYTDRAGDVEVSDTRMCEACCNPMEGCHSLSLATRGYD